MWHISKWQDMGYRVAIFRDHSTSIPCNLELRGKYPGYYGSINKLAREVRRVDRMAQWIVTGGDDMEPDPHKRADVIAAECTEHFGGTLGVMQPTGDRWGEEGHAYSERVAGSPWMGREWCRRAYLGNGPMPGGYWHYYGDEELQVVATRLGLFQQRIDLAHYHAHYMREHVPLPAFHQNAVKTWTADQALFEQRREGNFPNHQLL